MSIETLPAELIFLVCDFLEPADIWALSCISPLLHAPLTPVLHKLLPTYRNSRGETVLHHCARLGNAPLCKFALSVGVPVNAISRTGFAALHLAVRSSRSDIISLLLSDGAADINIEVNRRDGDTALHLAVSREYESKEIITLLFSHGANPRLRNRKGCTALHRAAKYGQPETLRLLLSNGANVEMCDDLGSTALHHAVHTKNVPAIEALLDWSDWGADIAALVYAGSPLRGGRRREIVDMIGEDSWKETREPGEQ
jgi:ankyrin repeat protein